ncbi:uncharacterized protein LOC127009548 [Eriocheir sinensis]|uniref:uncharacterized protein LOC127009548 n=1 Tax=Eriocheir sinensis TaxID=95602 RepID=UPI0021C65E27|nr:uncharacterized protein LOC127009548 [Eriocheir sinensis]
MSHLESGSVVWVRLGQAWWPGTITTVAKCPPDFVQAIRKTPIAIVKFFHENEYQDVHKEEHIFPYNCDRKEEFIRKGQAVNKNQSHGDVDLLNKFESDVVTAEKLTGGDMDILRSLVEGADTYKAFHHTHCPPTSPGLDSNNMVISGQPSQPPLASSCPAGVDFESRPQENLWPERVEAHTRLDSSTSKVRNPQNCQAASSDHQIAPLPRDLPSHVANITGRDLEQAQPNLGETSLISKHCSSNTGEEKKPAPQEKASSSRDISAAFMEEVADSEAPSLTSRMKDEEEGLDDEDEDEEDEEEDSLNPELQYESERFAESVDEDSLNLDLEMEGEEDEPEPQRPASQGEGEPMESESESDPLFEVEDEEDGSLAMLGTEQDGLVEAADEDEDSLIPDIEMESEEEEEEDGELSERITQTNLPQSWETDEDDSEEEMYQNLPSASATDEEEAGWVNGAEKENKGSNQLHDLNLTQQQRIMEDKSSSKEAEEEASSEKESISRDVEESSTGERERSPPRSKLIEEATKPSQDTPQEPLTQETNHTQHQSGDEDMEEEHTTKDKDEEKHNSHSPSHTKLTRSTKTTQDKGLSGDDISNQDSKDPVTLSLPVLESPSTSKSSDNSLNFEGFDREKTRQASARLLMLLKVRYRQPQRKPQNWKPKTVPKKRGRPTLKGHIGSVRGKRQGSAPVKRKRSQRAASTTSTTSDSDEGEEEEVEGAGHGSRKGKGGRSGRGWIKQRRARGRPNKRKMKHSPLRKRTLLRQRRKNTENTMEKRKTRSSDKEKEEEPPKITRSGRDPYERFAHSPDITSFSEAKPRQPRTWSGAKGEEDKAGQQQVTLGKQPLKRVRKRKPSEIDNLLQWAVETGNTGSRSRATRERQYPVTNTSTTSNNNNTNNNNNNNNNLATTRRSRLETKMANKVQKKRGRKKKVRTDTEEEEEEDDVESSKQGHSHSSSDDLPINSEGESSDTGKGKGRLAYPYKSGDLVWMQMETRWWPGYVDQVYPQTRRVSVYRVGVKQEASTKVDLGRVHSFQYGEVPDFVDRSESGFTEAFQVTESFCLLRNHGNKISAHKFFTMPPEEQDALIIVSFTPKDDPALSTTQGKRTRGSASDEPQSKSQRGWFYDPLNSDSEDGMGARGPDRYEMTALDRRRMQKSLRSRRRENEKLMKFMNSTACMDHLWQIFSGQKQCERHKLYQSEATRRSLLWSGIGPFQLDQDDDQILSVVDFLHTEMNKKQPDFNLAQDYVFKVWMPEAIKEALRVVLKVPEDMLELALDEGYRESLTDRGSRRLDFL